MSISNDVLVEPTIFTREYNAPRLKVFEAWTNADHLKKWMLPSPEAKCEYTISEIKHGSTTHHKITMPNGYEMWLLTKYENISHPDSFEFIQYMSNEAGKIVANPNMPNWPKHIRATILLEEINGNTHLQFIWQPIDPTQEEADVFEDSREKHSAGWNVGLNQLATYLQSM